MKEKDIPIFKTLVYKNNCYLYDPYTNNVFLITHKHSEELKILHAIGLSEYLMISEGNKEHDDIVTLINKGMLKSNFIEKIYNPHTPYIERLLNRCVSDITLQITKNCNFRCQYCLFATDSKVERVHENSNMSWTIAKESIDFLYSHSMDCPNVNIAFYGGEPLMNFNLIKKIVLYAENLFVSKKIRYIMTVNGSLLTETIVDFLVKYDFNITVSLDGPQDVQNRHRKFSYSGLGTFDSVMAGVKRIKEKYPEYFNSSVSFSPVIFPDEDYNEVLSFYQSIGVDLEKVNANAASLSGIDYIERGLSEQYNYRDLSENKNDAIFNDKSQINSIWHHNGPCIPGLRKLFIDTRGNFYTCEKFVENINSSIGNLKKGFDYTKVKRYLNIGELTEKECKSCWAVRFCSICAMSCINIENGELDVNSKKIMCITQKKKAIDLLKKYISIQ